MSLSSFFGKLGKVLISPMTAQKASGIGAVVSVLNPGLGAIIEMIASAVYQVEISAAAISGPDKKDAVKGTIDVSAPLILAVLSQLSGKPVDAAAVAPAIDKLIDDVVALFNSTGVFTHAPKPAAAIPPAALTK